MIILVTLVHLMWMQPAGSPPVDFFNVYGNEVLIWSGLPAPIEGIYEATVPFDLSQATQVWLTASNAAGESPPSNSNWFGPAPCCVCDWDHDGFVGAADWLELGRHFGQAVPHCELGDCTNDGIAGGADFLLLGQQWGQTAACTP